MSSYANYLNKDKTFVCPTGFIDNLTRLQNFDRSETTSGVTSINGSIIADNFILEDGTNLKQYIDNAIQEIRNSIGGTVSTLTDNGN